jgi:hypothetical protein
MQRTSRILASLLVLPVMGCYNADELGIGKTDPSDLYQTDDYKVVWTDRDDPALFADGLEYRLSELPQQASVSTAPWAGNYWPIYQDSINVKWNGASSESAAEKYGEAFGVADIEDKVSEHYGVDKYESRTSCTDDSMCNDDIGEGCAIREGETEGRCIPSWWGICHAWAPASMMEPEPINEVTRNGVTFKPNDIKALVSLAWDKTTTKFVSLRCNEDVGAAELDYDGYNRPTGSDAECADTNPGTYHVLLTNYLGIKDQSFVEDRTFDDEVWNQPLRGYRILEQTEVSAQRANELVGVTEGDADGSVPLTRTEEFNGSVQRDEWFHQPAITVEQGETVTVTMTGSGDADLYVAFGHEPSPTNWVCRPWLNGSTESCVATAPPSATQLFVSVNGYTNNSSYDVKVEVATHPGGGRIATDYVFNNTAAKLYHVRLDVDYITEAPSWLDGNLSNRIDDFTRTDHYQYILEVDSNDKIIGGEWIGSSKQNHPDFLWLPVGRKDSPIAGGAISYSHIQELLDASVAPPTTGGNTTEIATVNESGSLAQGGWRHLGPFENVAGTFRAEMTGTGDADLYVREGSRPTTSAYDCRPYRNGSTEECTVEAPGTFYVSVRGYTTSTFSLIITYTTEVVGGDDGGDAGTQHIDTNGHVNVDEWNRFTVELAAGQSITLKTTAPADVDLYVRMGIAPKLQDYDIRAWTVSGNETITYTATAAGTLHIGVNGYAASDYHLTTE